MVKEEKKKGETIVACTNDEKSKNDGKKNKAKPTLEEIEPGEREHDIVWCRNCPTAQHAKRVESHVENSTHGWKKAKRKNRGKRAKTFVPKSVKFNERPGAATRESRPCH